MEQATQTRSESTSTSARIARITAAWVAARNFDFFANSLANSNAVSFVYTVRNTNGVVATSLLSFALPRSAANGFRSLFTSELANTALLGASFTSPLANAAALGALFASPLGDAAATSSFFASPFSNAAGSSSLLRLANGYAVSVRSLFTFELGYTNWNFAALDFRNPYTSAYRSAAWSTSAAIAAVVATSVATATVAVASSGTALVACSSFAATSRLSSTSVTSTSTTATTTAEQTSEETSAIAAARVKHASKSRNLEFSRFPVSAHSSNGFHNGFLVRNSNGTCTGSLFLVRNHYGVFLGDFFRVGNTNFIGLFDHFLVRHANRVFLLHGFGVRNSHGVVAFNHFRVRHTYCVLDFLLRCYWNSFRNVIRTSTSFFLVLRNFTSTLFGGPLRDPDFACDVGRTTTAISRSGAWRG